MRASLLLVLYALASICSAQYVKGVDVSTPVSATAFQCLKQNGFEFVVARCWHSYNGPDTACPGTVSAALSEGFDADIYLFPNFPDGNPAAQVQGLASFVSQNGIKFGRLWFDIEVGSNVPSWGTCTENTAFLTGLVDAAQALGWQVGIYCSYYMWHLIGFCGGDFGSIPLWYAHYQTPPDPTMDDFVPFGNWTVPYAKQYMGTTTMCGVGVDVNNSTAPGLSRK